MLLEVDEKLHIRTYQQRAEFWEQVKVSNVIVAVCESQYVYLYEKYLNGKDKHMHFQIEWYQHCSDMLLDTMPRPCLQHKQSTSVWFDFRNDRLNQFSIDHCNAVLLSVQGAVYTYLNRKVV